MASSLVVLSCVVLAFFPSDDVSGWIGRLGSPRYQDRESAEKRLLDYGAHAIPALRVASQRGDDAEIQVRAGSILNRIEARTMLEPTRLNAWSEPIAVPELVRQIERGIGGSVRLVNLEEQGLPLVPAWRGTEPPTLWEALHQIESACDVRAINAFSGDEFAPGLTLSLVRPSRKPRIEAAESGPFRARVQSVSLHKSRNFDGVDFADAGDNDGRGSLHVQVQVQAEPRLTLFSMGRPRLDEVRDDLGQSLVLLEDPDEEVFEEVMYMASGGASSLDLNLELATAEKMGQSIRSLSGRVPALVLQRRSEPERLLFAGGAGKSIANESIRLTLKSVQTQAANELPYMEVEVAPTGDGDSAISMLVEHSSFSLAELLEQQCDVVDAKGQPLSLELLEIDGDGPPTRVRMALIGNEPGQKPVCLRLYQATVARYEIPFRFQDIPLP